MDIPPSIILQIHYITPSELCQEQYTEQYAEQYQRIFFYIVPLSKYCSFRGQKYIPKYQFDTLGL
jgi:hypothetical protein